MQKAYIMALYELVKKDKNIISLLSDSGTEYDELLKREFPEQCVNLGIAEENLVGVASGMAIGGLIPFVYTSGAFLAYRAFEFIRDDVCFQNLNVKIVGMGSGLAWSTLGPSHHTTEDISALRALPNLTIFSPASPKEVEKAVAAAYALEGPVYIRLGMSKEKEIYTDDISFIPGDSIDLFSGTDYAVCATGSIIEEAVEAVGRLQDEGKSVKLINIHTLKPLNKENLVLKLKNVKKIATIEEHNIIGGLGGILAEIISEENLQIPLIRLGLNDCFASGFGTQRNVRAENNLDSGSIYRILKKEFQ
ncbi:transketolase [Lachnospiraceae bacterium KGMB03038]|nr:transketolase [Lachnospiraceae bacterium KGMB03038]